MFDVTDFQIIPPFKNEPYIDPLDPEVRSQMMLALKEFVLMKETTTCLLEEDIFRLKPK